MAVVNLNKFRKAKRRTEKAVKATENRAKFGRTKAERAKDEEALAKRDALLDGAKKSADDE